MERKPQLERENVVPSLTNKNAAVFIPACTQTTWRTKKQRVCRNDVQGKQRQTERERSGKRIQKKVERGRDTGIEIKLRGEE